MPKSKTTTARPGMGPWLRPLIRNLHAYVPGEQPKIRGLVKLNTNENPYPPSPGVLRAVRDAVDGRLRLYPNPTAEDLRVKLAEFHRCTREQIIVGNGSDELLAMAVRCFVEPSGSARRPSDAKVQYFVPSYSLYPVLADMHGAIRNVVPLRADFGLPSADELRDGGVWDSEAALTFVTTPNAPSGRGYRPLELEALCASIRGVVVLDEAYVDFAGANALDLAVRYSNILVARTFSKAYSLCFQRVGYFVGHPQLVAALHKIRDSYNVNGLGQVAAEATLDDLPYYQANFTKVKATRERLATALAEAGFEVLPSETNFLLVVPPKPSAQAWLEALRDRKILVRWFASPGLDRYLRITVGTDEETDLLLRAVRSIARRRSGSRRTRKNTTSR